MITIMDYKKEMLDIAKSYPGLHYISFLNESKYKLLFRRRAYIHT